MPEVNGVRYVTIKNKKIYDLLKQKDAVITDIRVMQQQIDEIAKEGDKLGAKVQKIKDKALPLMEEESKKIELGEWEIVTTFQIEGDELNAQILDQVEAEKDRLRDAKAKTKK